MKVAALLACGTLAIAAPTAPPLRHSFSRKRHAHQMRADNTVDETWYLGTLKQTILKYNPTFQLPAALENIPSIVKKRQDADEALTDQTYGTEDELYYGTVTVGAAEQAFTIDFDTGSSDFFVPGPTCGTSEGCTGTTKYDEDGTDEGNTTTITYGSGQVTGENYFDSVTVAGLTATHQNVISLTEAEGFSSSDAEGLMGMAFQSIAASGQPPVFFTMIAEGAITNPEFSFYLGRELSGTGDASELTLGGADSSKYTGAFTSVPVSSQTYWQVALDQVLVNGATADTALASTAGQAAIDTGTTLILAPTSAAQAIYDQIPGSMLLLLDSLEEGVTVYSYPCDSTATVAIQFAGTSFEVNPLDFNFGEISDDSGVLAGLLGDSGAQCLGGIAGSNIDPDENLYVVGDTFLKNWYATFAYVDSSTASVSFAKSV